MKMLDVAIDFSKELVLLHKFFAGEFGRHFFKNCPTISFICRIMENEESSQFSIDFLSLRSSWKGNSKPRNVKY